MPTEHAIPADRPSLLARPGAVVEFSGRSAVGLGIRLRGWTRTSHVGVMAEITDQDLAEADRDGDLARLPRPLTKVGCTLVLAESTTLSTTPCMLMRRPICGVQCHDLDERIAEYDGRAWLWNLAPDFALDEAKTRLLAELVLRRIGTEYDTEGALWAGSLAIIKWMIWRPMDLHRVYCDEINYHWLSRVGVLPPANASLLMPCDMMRALLDIGALDDPIRIK